MQGKTMIIPHGHHSLEVRCPHCNYLAETRPDFGIALGPPLFSCKKCGGVFPSGRLEWPAISFLRKTGFVLQSTAYVLFISVAGGAASVLTVGVWRKGLQGTYPWDWPAFLFGTVAWGALVASIQCYRVLRSIGRSSDPDLPFTISFFTVQVDLERKFLYGIWIPPLIAFLFYMIARIATSLWVLLFNVS